MNNYKLSNYTSDISSITFWHSYQFAKLTGIQNDVERLGETPELLFMQEDWLYILNSIAGALALAELALENLVTLVPFYDEEDELDFHFSTVSNPKSNNFILDKILQNTIAKVPYSWLDLEEIGKVTLYHVMTESSPSLTKDQEKHALEALSALLSTDSEETQTNWGLEELKDIRESFNSQLELKVASLPQRLNDTIWGQMKLNENQIQVLDFIRKTVEIYYEA